MTGGPENLEEELAQNKEDIQGNEVVQEEPQVVEPMEPADIQGNEVQEEPQVVEPGEVGQEVQETHDERTTEPIVNLPEKEEVPKEEPLQPVQPVEDSDDNCDL